MRVARQTASTNGQWPRMRRLLFYYSDVLVLTVLPDDVWLPWRLFGQRVPGRLTIPCAVGAGLGDIAPDASTGRGGGVYNDDVCSLCVADIANLLTMTAYANASVPPWFVTYDAFMIFRRRQ